MAAKTEKKPAKTYSVFATRLRRLRKEAKLKQEDMARLLLIHRTAYTKYETDRATPDQKGLLVLSDLFHVSIDYLLGNDHVTEDEPKPLQLADNSNYVMLDILEQSLIAAFRQLPEQRRTEIVLSCRDEADQLKK